MSIRWVAEYRCRRYRHEWSEPAWPSECPKCGHLYLDWLNYEKLASRK